MRVTFQDIALKAGVSYSTVSRVINDHPSVSKDAAESVRLVMKELGYDPPPPEQRRGPVRGSPRKDLTGSLALLFPDADEGAIRTPLSAALTHGIEDYLYEQRMSLMVTHLREDNRWPVCLEKRQVDGVMIRGGDLPDSLVNHLRSYPAVWIFGTPGLLDWADQICPDNEGVALLACDYFTERNVGVSIVWDPKPAHVEFSRRARCFAESAAIGVQSYDAQDVSGLVLKLNQLVGKSNRQVGVFCVGDDPSAEALLREISSRGVEFRNRVELIVCCNDIARLRALDPQLPNIDIQPLEIGRSAAERLLWRLDNPKAPTQRVLINPRLDLVSA